MVAERKRIIDEDGFEVRRPVENFSFNYDLEISPDSWFGKVRHGLLTSLATCSDDLRFTRLYLAGMLSEAWDNEKFFGEERERGADSLDQILLISYLQHWATFMGLLSADEVREIREMGSNGKHTLVNLDYAGRVRKEFDLEPAENVREITRKAREEGRVVGMFQGSFAPPHWVHLSVAGYYHQLCDVLLVGIDEDDLLKRRKGGERANNYPFKNRHDVWKSFSHVADHVVAVPTKIFGKDGKYNDKAISEFYRDYNVGIVFFSRDEKGREDRIREIKDAGAIPYDHPLMGKIFSSTELLALENSESSYFTAILKNK